MSRFKDKSFKKCHTDNRKMIGEIHDDMISDMNDQEISSYYLDNGLLLDKYYKTTHETKRVTTGILSYLKTGVNHEGEGNVTTDTKKDLINIFQIFVITYFQNGKIV